MAEENQQLKEEWVSGEVSLKVGELPIQFQMTVPAFPVTARRMLPIFHKMANAMVETSIDAIKQVGEEISCKAGCGACCRQPVPIAEIEVYQIAELVESMPEPRRSIIKKRFADAAAHFHNIQWYERFVQLLQSAPEMEPDEAVRRGNELTLQYFHEGIPCPFLENESCSIHPDRPVVCREYLVTNPPENCRDPNPTNIALVNLLIKPSRAMRRLGSQGFLDKYGMPVLTRALEIAAEVPERGEEKSGPEWMREFFENLTARPKPSAEKSAPEA
ncbi:MAG TPA: YkgJ family cysteine cluster protein [Pyrinomonadaceae bacterium]|nr:YkgJ family cysteine cluster protein [Pyrinomonadaceae bacterium]